MGKRASLSKERVLATALKLADKGGTAGLTMRNLADKLGVEAMSLYHHVANKEAILDGLVDLVFAEIDVPTGPWKSAMRRRALSARQVLSRHGWAIGLMESRRNPGAATLAHHEAVVASLRKGGFSIAETAHAYSLIDSYIYGFAMQELALPFQNTQELEAMAGDMFAQQLAEQYPYMAEFMVEHALKPGYAYAKEFEFGLDLILDGLERMRSRG